MSPDTSRPVRGEQVPGLPARGRHRPVRRAVEGVALVTLATLAWAGFAVVVCVLALAV